MLALKAISICWRGTRPSPSGGFPTPILPLPQGEDTDACNKKQLASVGEGKILPYPLLYFITSFLFIFVGQVCPTLYHEFVENGKLGEYFDSTKDRSKKDTIKGFYPIYFNLETPNKTKKAEILIGVDDSGKSLFDMFLDYDRDNSQQKRGFERKP